MNLSKLSKIQLIQKIQELERLNAQLLYDLDQTVNFKLSWATNLGNWYLDFSSGTVVFNDRKINALGIQRSEIFDSIHYDFFMKRVHPDDVESTMQSMRDAMVGVNDNYETTYRIQHQDGSWRWFYDIGKVVQRDSQGRAQLAAGIVFDVTSQKNEEILLRKQSTHLLEVSITDELTGILNRRGILDELQYRLNPQLSRTKLLSIAIFDIDNFKTVNDTYGHLTGDEVLKQVAQAISDMIRGFDTVGRYGGEEFLVLYPNTELHKAVRAAERIRANVENIVFEGVGKITISGGVAQHKGSSATELIESADKALYEAKRKGRNQIRPFVEQ
jgi:diguanylate cyclase